MRIAAFLVALFTIVVGTGGLMSPERGTEIRRLYFATPARLYAAGAIRVGMGLVVILAAATSRAPTTLRALGAVMCMQGLAATLMGPDHARAVMEWETSQGTALLRVGVAVALATGVFLAFALTGDGRKGHPSLDPLRQESDVNSRLRCERVVSGQNATWADPSGVANARAGGNEGGRRSRRSSVE